MEKKSNFYLLMKLLDDNAEAKRLVNLMQDEINIAQRIKETAEDEADRLQEEADKFESIFIGLDTLHYYLESGNLKIQQQLDEWISKVKQENVAGVLMPYSKYLVP